MHDRSARPTILSPGDTQVEHGRLPPHEYLAPQFCTHEVEAIANEVEYFWFVRWQLPPKQSHTGRVLSDAAMHIVLEGGWSRIVGLVRGRFARTLWGSGELIGARLRYASLRRMSPLPAHQFTDRQVALPMVLPLERPDFAAQGLSLAQEHRQLCVEQFARFILGALDPGVDAPGHSLARKLTEEIHQNAAINTLSDLVHVAGESPRQLQRLFKEYIGAAPKWVIRRARILDAASRLRAGEAPALSELALRLGYHDQAHFSRDFRTMVGHSPGQFREQPS